MQPACLAPARRRPDGRASAVRVMPLDLAVGVVESPSLEAFAPRQAAVAYADFTQGAQHVGGLDDAYAVDGPGGIFLDHFRTGCPSVPRPMAYSEAAQSPPTTKHALNARHDERLLRTGPTGAAPRACPRRRRRRVLDLAASGAGQVEEQGGVDAMAAQPQVRAGPALPLHVIGADHDFVYVLDAEVGVMKARLAIHARQRRVRVQQEQGVVAVAAVGARIDAHAFLVVAEPEAQPVSQEAEARAHVGNREDNVLDGLGYGAASPFAMRVEPVDAARRVQRVGGGTSALPETPAVHRQAAVIEEVGDAAFVDAYFRSRLQTGEQRLAMAYRRSTPKMVSAQPAPTSRLRADGVVQAAHQASEPSRAGSAPLVARDATEKRSPKSCERRRILDVVTPVDQRADAVFAMEYLQMVWGRTRGVVHRLPGRGGGARLRAGGPKEWRQGARPAGRRSQQSLVEEEHAVVGLEMVVAGAAEEDPTPEPMPSREETRHRWRRRAQGRK
ncbi:hypothetical protein FQR65_LT17246 [Abscondita terminalis]|nr:hypothetical protein FQR65_LT17246 [Abscondita terminalis]